MLTFEQGNDLGPLLFMNELVRQAKLSQLTQDQANRVWAVYETALRQGGPHLAEAASVWQGLLDRIRDEGLPFETALKKLDRLLDTGLPGRMGIVVADAAADIKSLGIVALDRGANSGFPGGGLGVRRANGGNQGPIVFQGDDEEPDDREGEPAGGTATQSEETVAGQCGPDVTDWFLRELEILLAFQDHYHTIVRARVERKARAIENNKWFKLLKKLYPLQKHTVPATKKLTMEAFELQFLDHYASQITYAPHTSFVSRGFPGLCPTARCQNTCRLCQTCIDRSELGNFVYGAWAGHAGLPKWLTDLAGHVAGATLGRGFPADKADVAGWTLGFKYSKELLVGVGAFNLGVFCTWAQDRHGKLLRDMSVAGNCRPGCNSEVPRLFYRDRRRVPHTVVPRRLSTQDLFRTIEVPRARIEALP